MDSPLASLCGRCIPPLEASSSGFLPASLFTLEPEVRT